MPCFCVGLVSPRLVSQHSAIGDTISCDAPYGAIGFRGKFFLRCPPPIQGLSLDCDRPPLQKDSWGCSSDSLRYHRKHRATLGYFTRPQLGLFFCPEILAFTGFGARFLQPFPNPKDPNLEIFHSRLNV